MPIKNPVVATTSFGQTYKSQMDEKGAILLQKAYKQLESAQIKVIMIF